jgi:hypothetical protein
MSAVAPVQPSNAQTSNDPNSIVNLLKNSQQQKKQASSDTQFDTKKDIYEAFTNEERTISIATSFLIAAGILMFIGALIPKKK